MFNVGDTGRTRDGRGYTVTSSCPLTAELSDGTVWCYDANGSYEENKDMLHDLMWPDHVFVYDGNEDMWTVGIIRQRTNANEAKILREFTLAPPPKNEQLAAPVTEVKQFLSPEVINALPDEVRNYIMWLETEADPAGTIRENYRLNQENAALRAMLVEIQKENNDGQ